MLIVAFTAVAILAWLGAAVFVNTRRATRAGVRAETDRDRATAGIADEARRWLEQQQKGV